MLENSLGGRRPILKGGVGGAGGRYTDEPARNENSQAMILEWISPINFQTQQEELRSKRRGEIGHWFFQDPSFHEWESGTQKFLWCSGSAGVGKTMLVSMIIDKLINDADTDPMTGIACAYFNYRQEDIQTVKNILGALWRQLIQGPKLENHLKDALVLYQWHNEHQSEVTEEEMWKLLASTCQRFTRTFIVLDALDEYRGQKEGLIEGFLRLGTGVHLLLTCRPHIASSSQAKLVTIEATKTEIMAYINDILDRSQVDPSLRDHIVNTVTEIACGRWLIVELHMRLITSMKTKTTVENLIACLPATLDKTYQYILDLIKQDINYGAIGLSTLAWLTFTKRSLTRVELAAALEITYPDLNIFRIIHHLYGLVVTDGHNIRLVHYSTHEFLERVQLQEFPMVQAEITKSLLVYLQGNSHSGLHIAEHPPLLDYCQYFIDHAIGEAEEVIATTMLHFLDNFQPHILWTKAPWCYYPWSSPPENPLLWIAAAGNLSGLAKHILDGPQHKLISTEYIIAAVRGNLRILELLDSSSGNINNIHCYPDALLAASQYGHLHIVKYMISRVVNYLEASEIYQSALYAACATGHTDIARLLLSLNVDPDHAIGKYGTALQAACHHGSMAIVQLLLNSKADPTKSGGLYGTALLTAAIAGHLQVVQLLVQKDVDINQVVPQQKYGTSLQAAAGQGHKEIVAFLLQTNADPNQVAGTYGTALQAASARDYKAIVRLLLAAGADPSISAGKYGTALEAARTHGYPGIQELLLSSELTANLDSKSQTNMEPIIHTWLESSYLANLEHFSAFIKLRLTLVNDKKRKDIVEEIVLKPFVFDISDVD